MPHKTIGTSEIRGWNGREYRFFFFFQFTHTQSEYIYTPYFPSNNTNEHPAEAK